MVMYRDTGTELRAIGPFWGWYIEIGGQRPIHPAGISYPPITDGVPGIEEGRARIVRCHCRRGLAFFGIVSFLGTVLHLDC